MTTVTGLTATRMAAIEAASIISGEVVGDDLILTNHGGGDINAGDVRGPQGTPGADGADGTDGADGFTELHGLYTDFDSFPTVPIVLTTAILQTAVMKGSNVAWLFRYMPPSGGTNRWLFQGGARIESALSGSLSLSTATTVTALTSGPALVVPATGKYYVGISGHIQGTAAGLNTKELSARVGSGGTELAKLSHTSTTISDGVQASAIGKQFTLDEGDVIQCFCQNSAAVAALYENAQLTLEPVYLDAP